MTTTTTTTKSKELIRAEFIHKYTHDSGMDVFFWRSDNGTYFFDLIMPDKEETTYTVFSSVKSVAKNREENEKFIKKFLDALPKKISI